MASSTNDGSALPKVTLHWLEQSRSQRIVWLLQECKGIDLEIKIYKRVNMLAPPEMKKIHPLGKSPIVTIQTPGAAEPIVFAETGAITEYLTEYFAPHLIPERFPKGTEPRVGGETQSWLRYRHLMHYAEGSLMSLLVLALVMDQIRDSPQPFFVKPITRGITGRMDEMFLDPNYKSQFGFLNEQLATSPCGGKFITGKSLTAVDILLSYPLVFGKSKINLAAYPKLAEYIDMLEQHPGYQQSVKKIEELTGEPFQLHLQVKH